MKNKLKAIVLGSVMLLSGCKVFEKVGLWPPPAYQKLTEQQTESELYPKFSVEKGIGFRMLEDGIDIRVDVDGDGREDMAYKLVPVGYNEEEGIYLMAPLEVYIDMNKNEQYTEDERFKTTLAGG